MFFVRVAVAVVFGAISFVACASLLGIDADTALYDFGHAGGWVLQAAWCADVDGPTRNDLVGFWEVLGGLVGALLALASYAGVLLVMLLANLVLWETLFQRKPSPPPRMSWPAGVKHGDDCDR